MVHLHNSDRQDMDINRMDKNKGCFSRAAHQTIGVTQFLQLAVSLALDFAQSINNSLTRRQFSTNLALAAAESCRSKDCR
jgi:hypothetical protein